jgi:hypothetical protein
VTRVYENYLIIARLVAERARLVRLLQIYPHRVDLEKRLSDVCRELMRHQTSDEVDCKDYLNVWEMFL